MVIPGGLAGREGRRSSEMWRGRGGVVMAGWRGGQLGEGGDGRFWLLEEFEPYITAEESV